MPAAPIRLPVGLHGPVDVALLRSAEQVPPVAGLPGGCVYEPKWDGFRIAIVRNRNGARLWSRQGRDLAAAFPDLVAAAEFHLAPGTVCDGVICSQIVSVANGSNE